MYNHVRYTHHWILQWLADEDQQYSITFDILYSTLVTGEYSWISKADYFDAFFCCFFDQGLWLNINRLEIFKK
jgi:hypothetical protein